MITANVMNSTCISRPAGLISVDGRLYPLRSARVEARAEGGVAATTLIQSFDNPYEEPLEVFYTLPLPASGAVVGYTMTLGKRFIRGEVRRREEAREEYRKAIVEGRAAALLEQERADTFTQKLGSLPSGESAEIRIEVLQPLAYLPSDGKDAPRWEYRFPTVAGVRYEGAPGRVPDAERLDVDRAGGEGTPVRLEAALLIADGAAEAIHPHSPGHEVIFEECREGVRVLLRDGMRLDRDLVIRWAAAQAEVGVRTVEGKGLPGDGGRYLMITLTPPAAVRESFARDLTLLIDASGSMSGAPLERAKIVAEGLLRSLGPGDRFEVAAFADSTRRLVRGPVEATEQNLSKAVEALQGLQAGGGTEMRRAIVEALRPLRPDSQRQVILITDGYIGFESEVVGEIRRSLAPGARLHAVGVGSAPNRTLTRGAARAGGGMEILVGDDDARSASRRLLKATVRPVLTNVEAKGSALVSLAPARASDILEGQPLVLLAEVKAAGGTIEIRGSQAGAADPWVQQIDLSGKLKSTTIPLGALFGREAIEDAELLLAAARPGHEAQALESKIESLGLRHRIASRKTSLVAFSEEVTVDPRAPRRRQRLAVELPAEVSAECAGLAPARFVRPARFQFADLSAISGGRHIVSEVRGPFLMEDHAEAAFEFRQPEYLEEPEEEMALQSSMITSREYEPPVFEGRIVMLDGPEAVLEFEAPVDGFSLPPDQARVRIVFSDGSERDAVVLGEESSPIGPHDAGLTVRLVLVTRDGGDWRPDAAEIRWETPEGEWVTLHLAPPE